MGKEKAVKERLLKMKSGETYAVKRETGKYWVCEHTRFRKANENIESIIVMPKNENSAQRKKTASDATNKGEVS